MSLPKFLVLTLMIAIAVVVMLVYGEILRRRHAEFVALADLAEERETIFAQTEINIRHEAAKMENDQRTQIEESRRDLEELTRLGKRSSDDYAFLKEATDIATKSIGESIADIHKTRAEVAALRHYQAQLRRKYRRAARYPWLPVAPDPPEPE